MDLITDYQCRYCCQKFSKIRDFCEHSKIHQNTKNFSILCCFPNCQARLSLSSFKSHVRRQHELKIIAPDPSPPLDLPCPVPSCAQRISSSKFYRTHMATHLKEGVLEFECLFEGCTSKISNIRQFRTHQSRYHPQTELLMVPTSSNVSSQEERGPEMAHQDIEMDVDDHTAEENFDWELNSDCCDTDLYPDSLIKDELAKFYLKLESVFILPSSTVQAIAEEIKIMTELSHYRLKRALTKELESSKVMEKDMVASIVKKTFKHDTVFNVHHKHEDVEQLGTIHSRSQYWAKSFPFVKPQEIPLGFDAKGKKRVAHYVPIRDSLRVLLKDEKVKEAVLRSFEVDSSGDSQILRDYSDGTVYKEHSKTHHGPCLQLHLFQDAFDFNAFGPSTGLYKPVGFYYTLGNIPAVYRSKVDLIQIVYMVLENDMKPSQEDELKDIDKMKASLKPLLTELEDLKVNGLEIDGNKIPVCLLFCLGDSLGQNIIGGFVKNFSSSQFSCRFCPMSKSEFLKTPFETKPFRKADEYDNNSAIAKHDWLLLRRKALKDRQKAKDRAKQAAERCSDPSKKKNLQGVISKDAYKRMLAVNYRGVKYRPSPLNSIVTGFHVVGAQPPCLAHDLFEGIVKSVVGKILKYFIETKEWFDLPCLNRRIKSFRCKGADARDAPTPLKSLDHLSGNACENWNMLRLLPLMIGDLIEEKEDPMWQLFLSLKQICEFACAPSITVGQVSYLEFLIQSYLARVQDLLPSCLTPKHHYLCHYPLLFMMFGPLIRLFTLRFESKHKFFKDVVSRCHSYINITFTMAKKYMCRFAFDHSSDLLPLDVVYNSNLSVGMNANSLPEDVSRAFPLNFDFHNVEMLQEVSVNGIKYCEGYYFVLKSEGSDLKVGCIRMIMLERGTGKVIFLINEMMAENSFNGYYAVNKKSSLALRLTTIPDLPDYYALPSYECSGHECLTLKHSVITME